MVNGSTLCLPFNFPLRRYIARKQESKKTKDADNALEYPQYRETAAPTTTIVTLSLWSDYSLTDSTLVVRSRDGADTEMNALTSDCAQPSDPCRNVEKSPTSSIEAS